KAVANWVQSDFLARVKAERTTPDKAPVTSVMLAELAGLVSSGKVSGKAAKDLFAKAWETGRNPGTLVAELGLAQVSDESSVSVWVDEAIAENAKAAADVRAGKEAAVGALVGAVMKRSRGKANPALVNKLIKEKLAV
ncbi:Asp-tRNA(Asn)/Glu-tRNA(Gln) amidotransferase GatCAB subunit B, partial [bacterium]